MSVAGVNFGFFGTQDGRQMVATEALESTLLRAGNRVQLAKNVPKP
jgi:hypothetical protein